MAFDSIVKDNLLTASGSGPPKRSRKSRESVVKPQNHCEQPAAENFTSPDATQELGLPLLGSLLATDACANARANNDRSESPPEAQVLLNLPRICVREKSRLKSWF